MKHIAFALVALSSLSAAPVRADEPREERRERRAGPQRDERRDEQSRRPRYAAPPARGPEPVRVEAPPARERGERQRVDERSRWMGHDTGRADVRYRLDRPWAAGRFGGGLGRAHVYPIEGWEPSQRRFWFGGHHFIVATTDWGYANDWDWRSDQVTVYEDPDHEGWYLAYNVRLASYVHVQYATPPQ